MTFVTTSLAIAGLAAVSIPILIHLLSRQRRRPIEWAAMRFLIEAFRKQRRRLRVQQLLLLTVRCLIVLLLGAALARPLLQHAGLLDSGSGRTVHLLIDDGMVSGLTDETGESALSAQIASAIEVVEALGPGDRIGVITAARPAAALLMPPSSDHAAVIRLLRSVEPKDSPTDLAGALTVLQTALEEADQATQHVAYLLSEFRSGSAALDSPLPGVLRELGGNVTLMAAAPAEQPRSNVQIAEISPVRNTIIPGAADGSGQVTVRLTRYGGALDADVSRVRLTGTGLTPPEPRVVQWEPGQSQASVEFLLNVDAQRDGAIALTAQLDDDLLNADNIRHSVLDVRSRIRIVLLERRSFGFEARLDRLNAGQWIRRALEPREGGPLQMTEVEPMAMSESDLRTADVVVASRPDLINEAGWAVLRQYVDRGGLLLVTPPGQMNVHQWTDRFITELDLPWRIGLEVVDAEDGIMMADEQPRSELLRLVSSDLDDLARSVISNRVLPIDSQQTQATNLLTFSDGSPMVIAGSPRSPQDDEQGAPTSRGLVVFFATSPELTWTNLPSKPLMVPLMHELVRQGLSSIRAGQQLTTGEQPAMTGYGAATDLIGPNGERIALSANRPQQPLQAAGLYEVHDAASQRLAVVAVNVVPSAGSSEAQPESAVMAWLGGSGPWGVFDPGDPAASLRASATHSPLAGILLLIVLALVLIETLLARWFSNAYEGHSAVTMVGDGALRPTIHQRDAIGGAV